MTAANFYNARILHYINSELDAAREKFRFREHFNTQIFDKNLATDEVRERYKLWEDKWTQEEGMPSDTYYNAMWKAVQVMDSFILNSSSTEINLQRRKRLMVEIKLKYIIQKVQL